jgi:hypothetical protein
MLGSDDIDDLASEESEEEEEPEVFFPFGSFDEGPLDLTVRL